MTSLVAFYGLDGKGSDEKEEGKLDETRLLGRSWRLSPCEWST